MMKKNIFVLCGGEGQEHDVSLVSAKYFIEKIKNLNHNAYLIILDKNLNFFYNDKQILLENNSFKMENGENIFIDFLIPCLHGFPGETGHIQSILDVKNINYLGSSHEASILAFNKISTKLWANQFNIPVVPFVCINALTKESLEIATNFFNNNKSIFIKASNQGSSVGCYPVNHLEELESALTNAFELSNYVLIEKTVEARELEVSVFEYNGKLNVSDPGEIICPSKFYSYSEKYNAESKTITKVKAQNLSKTTIDKIKNYAMQTFQVLKLRHLARIDFFYDEKEDQIYLNEPNTMPGHTNISMFPQMLEASGIKYEDFLNQLIK